MSRKHHPHIDAAIATASTHLGALADHLDAVEDEKHLPEGTQEALKAFKAQLAEFGKAKPKEAAPAKADAGKAPVPVPHAPHQDVPKKAEK
jgi:hypothetical protein